MMAIERELAAELDPRRIQTREGSAGKKLSYLTTHDVKRTANRIFGYDGWSYVVDELISLGEEPFKNSRGREGIRVGYRATVTVTIGDVQRGDVGYGDAMEYNGSRITPHELASKEAVSDALKRCLSSWGDQFGLVLYGADPAPLEDEVSESPRGASRSPARASTSAAPTAPATPPADEHVLSTADLKLPPSARYVVTKPQIKKMWGLAHGFRLSDDQVREIMRQKAGVEHSDQIERRYFDAVLKEIEDTGMGTLA